MNIKSSRTFIPWSTTELNQFLEVAEKEGVELLYHFALLTGLRLGEILAITWSDIDFEEKTVTVSKHVSFDGNVRESILNQKRFLRRMPLTQHLHLKLEKHKKEQQVKKAQSVKPYHDLDLVFPKSDGSIQSYYSVRRQFNRLIVKANVRKMTFHGLRKMYITMLLDTRASIKTIADLTGIRRFDSLIKYLEL